VAVLGLPTYSERKSSLDKLRDELSAHALFRDTKPDAAKSTKVIGDVVAAQFLPNFVRARIVEDRTRQSTRNLKTALALAAFRADHERFPAQLVELMPTYLAEIPTDVFTGQMPIYRRQHSGYLLYSVGQDGRDDGGRAKDSKVDDLPVRMSETR
jgi:hypothetical protein